ncbi:MAG: hypothetical protein H6825_11530 [Planctomycetes bacterium]|nr:hypothetical protein [Planctomycetota bacterium]
MSLKLLVVAAAVGSLWAFSPAPQQTPKTMTTAYSSLADTILAVKQAEEDFVRCVIDGHFHAASALAERGKWDDVAAEMALFASEGDNAMAGVRKRLLDGGHHHHADGEAKGLYEPGFVIVTRRVKEEVLAAAAAMRKATNDAEHQAAWKTFKDAAEGLLLK